MNAAPAGSTRPDLGSLLPASPDAYPQALDVARGLVLVVRMSERAYGAASFLDDRILGPGTEGAWFTLASAARAAGAIAGPRPLHFIFHTGHVGSTLLSRLLDEAGTVLGLREPLPLRTLAEAQDVLGRPESLLAAAQFEGWAIGVRRRGHFCPGGTDGNVDAVIGPPLEGVHKPLHVRAAEASEDYTLFGGVFGVDAAVGICVF